eukprot:8915359-Pyramimonas_sp.AAC.1
MGLGYCRSLCDGFNAYLTYHLLSRLIRRFRRLFVARNRQIRRCMETPRYKKVTALAANRASCSSRVNTGGMPNQLS